jgi:S1-C subfamily serine protease
MRFLILILLVGMGFGTFFVYQIYVKQNQVVSLQPVICDQANKQDTKTVQVVETVVHKTSPWGALQPKLKDAIVQVFVQIAEFNWIQPYQTPMQKMATGTGFFIDEMGHFITNAHVVNQAKSVTIQVPSLGKEQLEAEIISVCFDRDIALLKLKAPDFDRLVNVLGKINFLPVGDSDQLYRADQIMYQGFPLGQQGLKSTVGVVSGRENMGGRQYIQIDAATNPGCSGGPALNLNGEVVGVLNSGIMGAQNVGYIIPAKELKVVLHDLYHSHNPLVRRPFLGVAYNSGSPALSSFLDNPVAGGAYVITVYKNSVLATAGVKAGDIMHSINGHIIDYYGEISVPWAEDKISLGEYASYLLIEQPIELVVYRQGQRLVFNFKFEQPKLPAIRVMYPDFEKIDYEVVGGFVIMELALNHVAIMQQVVDDLIRYKNPKNQSKSRLVITHIFPASLAQRARIFEPGNILKSINEEQVFTLADLRKALAKSADTNRLTIRTKQNVFAVLPFDKVLQQEAMLSSIYHYPISETMQNLLQSTGGQN